jgi:hypothetical protein
MQTIPRSAGIGRRNLELMLGREVRLRGRSRSKRGTCCVNEGGLPALNEHKALKVPLLHPTQPPHGW